MNKTVPAASDAIALAELVIGMDMGTERGKHARHLARKVLGIPDVFDRPNIVAITTNGTTRFIPEKEPVFLIRGQDVVGADAVRAWADLAEANGASPGICDVARKHAATMDDWPKKKQADLPHQAIPSAALAAQGQELVGAPEGSRGTVASIVPEHCSG